MAQSSQILSVTPPLFQLSVGPGDIWQSSIKVVNGNPYDLTVYADVVNFAPVGESGRGRFIPLLNNQDEKATLAEWIEIVEGPHVIKPEQSKEIQFFVDVPNDAAPGGHSAAILVGTKPPEDSENPLIVHTSQVVTSLFFVRIEGDVIELGNIRQFSTVDSFLEEPTAEFLLRFENKGNVHLQPRGDIVITNMWGKERGVIPINHQSHYGNVLPKSIREFKFIWKGERTITEIGRYKAIATLAYGENGIKSVDSATYFWVVPVKATLITLGSIIAFVFFVTWMIRLYVRKMLTLAGVDVGTMEHVGTAHTITEEEDVRVTSPRDLSAPIRSGLHDLHGRLQGVHKIVDVAVTLFEFARNYRIFFGAVLVIVVGFVGVVLYISDASEEQKSYEITIDEGDRETTVDSEEILKERLQNTELTIQNDEQHFILNISNAGGVPGAAAEIAVQLEEVGYVVRNIDTAPEREQTVTIIEYDQVLEDEMRAIVGMLEWMHTTPIETVETNHGGPESEPILYITVGSDYIQNE